MQNRSPQAEMYAEVLELLENYCKGLHTLDTQLLAEVFSPNASYATIRDGEPLALAIGEYLPLLAQRTAPADDGTPFDYTVDSIQFAGPHTALAQIRCSMFGHDYTDLLSLLRMDGRWRIQSKVFEGVPQTTQGVA